MGIAQLGHTEQKALERIGYLGPGVRIEFRGSFPVSIRVWMHEHAPVSRSDILGA
jgi:hypothetical protein